MSSRNLSYVIMDLKWSLLISLLVAIFLVEVIESNRRGPQRPPNWRPPQQHQGRGGLPIPIHENNGFNQRRIHMPPPGPNKFGPPPPHIRKGPPPPPGYFNKPRRPPPPGPPPGGPPQGPPPPYYNNGFNYHLRPPLPPQQPPSYTSNGQFNTQHYSSVKQPPTIQMMGPNYGQTSHQLESQSISLPTPTTLTLPSTPSIAAQPQSSTPQQYYNFQQPHPNYGQSNAQNVPTNVSSGSPLIVGSIQASQQTVAQSNQHMTIVKPPEASPSVNLQPSASAQSQQIYQFHLPPSNGNQPNSIIQIHLSSTTEASTKDGVSKDYFTGSTLKPYKQQQPQDVSYPNTEYLPHHKLKSTLSPPVNYHGMNADKAGVNERPIIYKNSKESEDRPYKSHYTKPGAGQHIDITSEAPPSAYHPEPHYGKSDYEHALSPPSKNDYGLLPSKQHQTLQDYGLSSLAKHDYEHYKNYKEYANKYSQLDPLYHPDSEVKLSAEDPETELSLPGRYDNSFSTNYKHDEQTYGGEESRYGNQESRKGPSKPHQPQPEEILSALGLSTNPLDHVDIVKTAHEKYKKEPLYSLPDRQVEEDEEIVDDEDEAGYPGTSYNMEKSGSRHHLSKRPPPLMDRDFGIKGLNPPSLGSHLPDHRDDIITADGSNEYYNQGSKIRHREDTPVHYGLRPQSSYHRPNPSASPKYPYPYGQHEYVNPSALSSTNYQHHLAGPSPAPSHLHFGPTVLPYARPIYVTEPDPIIEIIVQDSNVTLPPIPRPKLPPPLPPTPEPVHVFYVRYSNNNQSHYGAASEPQGVRLESPIPAVPVKTPNGNVDSYQNPQKQLHFNNFQQYQQHQATQLQPTYIQPSQHLQSQFGQLPFQQIQQQPQQVLSPQYLNSGGTPELIAGQQAQATHFSQPQFQLPPAQPTTEQPHTTTTLRAIIRLDKNEYESNHLKVAFDALSNPFSHLQHQHQSHREQGGLQSDSSMQHTQVVQPFFNQLNQNQNNVVHGQQFSHSSNNGPPASQANPPNQGNQQYSPQAFPQQQQQFLFQQNSPGPFQQSTQPFTAVTQHVQQPAPLQASPQVHLANQHAQAQFEVAGPSHQQPQGQQFQPQPPQTQTQQFQPQPPQTQTQDILNHIGQQVAQFHIPSGNHVDIQVQPNEPQAISPSEQDFNMDPAWTNWNQQMQHQNQFEQQPSPSNNIPSLQLPSASITPSNPASQNNVGTEVTGHRGFQSIGTENNIRNENPLGLRPPHGPVYPKLGGFSKRIGLDDLATLLGEESVQGHQGASPQKIISGDSGTTITATYHDPDQEKQLQQQFLQAGQAFSQQQNTPVNQQFPERPDPQGRTNKLPDDVPEELKQQLIDSGILGNAEIQVINYDQNLFKELTNLPSDAALESFSGGPDELTRLLGASMSVGPDNARRAIRSVLVVNEGISRRPLRRKRKDSMNKLVLFIEDRESLIYNVKKHSTIRVLNSSIQNAIDYTHHKHT